ncbi:MAG TPA: helix-turn-helix domain-containing protein [Nitrospiraceae bacterium]|jgi:excisionase family DNA binding protein|nr:helix-turn-helix domain-containing protein [Nitrospiraceae bacterium]
MNDTPAAATDRNANEHASVPSEILTVEDVARFLRVPKSTVYKLARLGRLPAVKIGKHWRFLRGDLHAWMHIRAGRET